MREVCLRSNFEERCPSHHFFFSRKCIAQTPRAGSTLRIHSPTSRVTPLRLRHPRLSECSLIMQRDFNWPQPTGRCPDRSRAEVPAGLESQPAVSGRVVLAEGERSGHAHTLSADPGLSFPGRRHWRRCPRMNLGLGPRSGESHPSRARADRVRRMVQRLRLRQEEHSTPRPAHPSPRNRRDRQRELALQDASLTPGNPRAGSGCVTWRLRRLGPADRRQRGSFFDAEKGSTCKPITQRR